MAPRVTVTNVTLITGGCMKGKKAWSVPGTEITRKGDKVFIHIGKADRQFRRFVGEKFDMMEHMIELRNEKCDALMADSPTLADPMRAAMREDMAAAASSAAPHIARREMVFLEVAEKDPLEFITVEVRTPDGRAHDVNLLPHWRKQSKLGLELTESNLTLLSEDIMDPKEKGWRPTFLNTTNVKWNVSRHSVYISYRNDEGAWAFKHKTVPAPEDDEASDVLDKWQAIVDEAAEVLEAWRTKNHVEEAECDEDEGDAAGEGVADDDA